jgi:hypothetical protein
MDFAGLAVDDPAAELDDFRVAQLRFLANEQCVGIVLRALSRLLGR